jgi:GR25 family glycosyltransferase involved in LPS biosynthesis
MELIDKLFYINLDDKTDRKHHFLEQCKLHNIPDDKVERYSAINGKSYLFTKEQLDMFKNADFNIKNLSPYIITKKLMGNQLSHYNILLEMKKRNYNNIIICQDDAIFKQNFVHYIDSIMKDIPDNTELINLGMHKKAAFEDFIPYDLSNTNIDENIIDKQITEFVYSYRIWNSETRHRVNPASLAYIVTKKGCDNIINYFNQTGFRYATDWNYNLYLQSKNIFYGSKYVLATGNNSFKSDIFVDTDNYLLEDLIDNNLYYTDKNTTHSYFDTYNELFQPIRRNAKNILEIGNGIFSAKNGGSILLWNLFFKNALIHLVDIISENRVYDVILKNKDIRTYLNTNAYDLNFVKIFKNSNTQFDLIIDDGPHTLETQCKCIELYSELLSDNGILIIEDVQDIKWIEKIKEITPPHLHKFIHVYDLRKNKNRYDDILFVINKNIVNTNYNDITNVNYNDITIPLALSYENDLSNNQNAQIFKKTLEKYNWEYKFIGEGIKWNGFRDKVIGYYNFLNNNLIDDKIVVLSDARDVFCLKKSNFFIDQIKEIVEDKIIISSEMFLLGRMNWSEEEVSKAISKDPEHFWQGVPLNEYWKFHEKNPIPFRKYLNSGLIVGKAKNLKTALKWIIDNNFNDDQLGFCNYTNKFPDLVYFDYEANILHTSTSFVCGSLFDYNIQKQDSPTFHELLGFSNYFLHIPGINLSKGQKYIYDTIYTLFNTNVIDKNMFDIYNLKEKYPIKNIYVIKN